MDQSYISLNLSHNLKYRLICTAFEDDSLLVCNCMYLCREVYINVSEEPPSSIFIEVQGAVS